MEADHEREIRSQLRTQWSYAHLKFALLPDLKNRPDIEEIIRASGEWLENSNQKDLVQGSPTISEGLTKIIELSESLLPSKEPWRKIAVEHWDNLRSGAFSYTHGIAYGWLAERFDCSKISIPADMPYHARIGVWNHIGNAATEEYTLLRDSFYMLALGESSLQKLESFKPELSGMTKLENGDYKILSRFNQNTATFSRQAVSGFYSFVECFINSVGEDFVGRNKAALSPQEIEILRGRKKSGHLSTERKLETFPSIIRLDGQRPIVMTDEKQIREPFKSFVKEVKDVRDSATHFSIHKAPLIIPPQEWVDRAKRASEICLEVAEKFWTACYPRRDLPHYLGKLDRIKQIALATERVNAMAAIPSFSQSPSPRGTSPGVSP
jgi:hypothetical protein